MGLFSSFGFLTENYPAWFFPCRRDKNRPVPFLFTTCFSYKQPPVHSINSLKYHNRFFSSKTSQHTILKEYQTWFNIRFINYFWKFRFLCIFIDYFEPNKCKCCPHVETSQMICCANQLIGFYMRAILAFNGLITW